MAIRAAKGRLGSCNRSLGRGRLGHHRNVQGGLRGCRSGHRQDRSGHGWLLSHRRCGWLLNRQRLKVSGVAKPPPWVAEPLQLWASSLAQPPRDALVQRIPPNLPASCMSAGWQPPLPPPRWLHLFLGGPPPPPLLLPGAGKPALCPSQLGAATPPVWWVPYPGPLSWQPALTRPPGHLDHPPKFQPPAS